MFFKFRRLQFDSTDFGNRHWPKLRLVFQYLYEAAIMTAGVSLLAAGIVAAVCGVLKAFHVI